VLWFSYHVVVVGSDMSTKVFVGRLTDGTTNDELHSLFRKFGTVTESVSMGNYGFVVVLNYFKCIMYFNSHSFLYERLSVLLQLSKCFAGCCFLYYGMHVECNMQGTKPIKINAGKWKNALVIHGTGVVDNVQNMKGCIMHKCAGCFVCFC